MSQKGRSASLDGDLEVKTKNSIQYVRFMIRNRADHVLHFGY
jgi:hypothetical protein